jgi:hypothetical protein
MGGWSKLPHHPSTTTPAPTGSDLYSFSDERAEQAPPPGVHHNPRPYWLGPLQFQRWEGGASSPTTHLPQPPPLLAPGDNLLDQNQQVQIEGLDLL